MLLLIDDTLFSEHRFQKLRFTSQTVRVAPRCFCFLSTIKCLTDNSAAASRCGIKAASTGGTDCKTMLVSDGNLTLSGKNLCLCLIGLCLLKKGLLKYRKKKCYKRQKFCCLLNQCIKCFCLLFFSTKTRSDDAEKFKFFLCFSVIC